MLTPFDTLVDAISHCSGYRNPTSEVYKARNPGGLRAFSPATPRTAGGYRIFKTDIDGLQALKFDVRLKISGHAKRQCSTLAELAAAYDQPVTAAKAWVAFIRLALADSSVSPKTPLTYFLETK